jgi:hypothetical protein
MYKLVRINDNLIKESLGILFVEWNEDKSFKKNHSEPKVGFTLYMGFLHIEDVWMTSAITEIIEQTDDLLHFKTENSEYKLFNIKFIQENLFLDNKLPIDSGITIKPYSFDKPKKKKKKKDKGIGLYELFDLEMANGLGVDVETYIKVIETKCSYEDADLIISAVMDGDEKEIEEAKKLFNLYLNN